ncbi:MAG: hypothetical protein A3F35_00620 [Candidatus Woykebacteria bacterium RIFCSPHIGHO2_12_FULL_45_10]|uniref:Response regulatory domain-containing protein n=1 Tax=Candidatus Woykebacteria bacterium RIFCSPHIGHO2_12_FULL_45_10 TaxID=1802603 RepID=A0A1G1WR09_9BACT|nr:MAG: hypothetical protein A3F35_00620 [Candidatus Woykebacteria bacterium RIFCSPHIGHO2_12_FULL_45_10]
MAKVLLIESNKQVREMYRTLIENAGFDVTSTLDAREGKEALSKENFSSVIINSPRQETFWFLGVVRASHNISVSTVPILVILEDSNDSSLDYIEAGASKCLSKFPASGERLIEELRSILNIPKLQLKS